MNEKINKLLAQVLQLCILINDETEAFAIFSMGHKTATVVVKSTKACYCRERLFSDIIYLDDGLVSQKSITNDYKAFKTFALNLIKEQNPPTYQRIKQQFNA